MGPQSSPLVERVLPRLCRPWRQDATRPLRLPPLADDRCEDTPAGAASSSTTDTLEQATPEEGNTHRGEHCIRPAKKRLLTQRTQLVSRREPHGRKGKEGVHRSSKQRHRINVASSLGLVMP